MKKTLTTVMFRGTKAQEEQLDAVIAELKGTPGALMPVLQQAQEIYGYLPIEVQKMIALKMGVSIEEVYGVSTFYSQFVLNPKGEVDVVSKVVDVFIDLFDSLGHLADEVKHSGNKLALCCGLVEIKTVCKTLKVCSLFLECHISDLREIMRGRDTRRFWCRS